MLHAADAEYTPILCNPIWDAWRMHTWNLTCMLIYGYSEQTTHPPGVTSSEATTKRNGQQHTATGSSCTLAALSRLLASALMGSARPSLMQANMLLQPNPEHTSCWPCTMHKHFGDAL